ncbi:MAG: SNF2-related protein, partial [Pyrinomonadaceae bacterium]
MKGEVDRVLIVCPSGVMDVWIDEIRKSCPYRRRITVWDKQGRKRFDLPPFDANILDFVIINYEALSTPGAVLRRGENGEILKRSESRGGRFTLKKQIIAWQPHMMILDESHRIKSPSAKKTTTIWSIAWKENRKMHEWTARIPYRMILTGTVLTKRKRIFDIYSQWKFLNRKSPLVQGMTLAEFKELYAVWTSRNGFPQWLRNRPSTMRKLRTLLHDESFAITRDECYDLPARLEPTLIYVALEESGPYYDAMAEEMVARLESGEFTWAKIPLVQRLRLSQITSGIVKTEPTENYTQGRLVRIGREKLRTLEDLLYDQFEAEEKVVIGARFRGDLSSIKVLVTKLKVPVWELHGGILRTDRTKNIQGFKKHQGPGVFLAQPDTAALGIDLSTSATMIWFSLTNSWVNFTQFEDRIALSSRAIRFYYLLAQGTVDELQHESLGLDG